MRTHIRNSYALNKKKKYLKRRRGLSSCHNWFPDFLLVRQNSFNTAYPMNCQNKPVLAAWIRTWNTHSYRGHVSFKLKLRRPQLKTRQKMYDFLVATNRFIIRNLYSVYQITSLRLVWKTIRNNELSNTHSD